MSLQVGLVERNPLLGMLGIMVSLQVELVEGVLLQVEPVEGVLLQVELVERVLLQVEPVEGVLLLGMLGGEELLKVGLVDIVSPWSGKVLLQVGLAERRPLLEALGRGVPLQVGLVEGELLPIVLGGEMWPYITSHHDSQSNCLLAISEL